MIVPNKFHVLLCLAVLTFTAVAEDKSNFTEYLNGMQAVSAVSPFNETDDLDLCLLKPDNKISHEYGPIQYSFHKTTQKSSNYYAKSPRAPPLV